MKNPKINLLKNENRGNTEKLSGIMVLMRTKRTERKTAFQSWESLEYTVEKIFIIW